MSIKHGIGWLALALCLTSTTWAYEQRGDDKKTTVATPKPDPVRPNNDAMQMQDFKRRVDAYLEVHTKAAKDVPPLKETKESAEITRAQEALAVRIRAVRTDARPGDIFTPEIRNLFRRLLAPELKGEDGSDAKLVLKDDAPPSVPLKVNARYPEGASRPTVPASVLSNLPPLPKEVEYRIIEKDLILLDTQAGIVVDYIAQAIR